MNHLARSRHYRLTMGTFAKESKSMSMTTNVRGGGIGWLKHTVGKLPVFGSAARKIYSFVQPESVWFENMLIPAAHLRFGGNCFNADRDFACSARKEADRLVQNFGLTRNSSLLEIGCGPGRLPLGIIDRVGDIRSYHGLDVSRQSIAWCRKHITPRHPSFRFVHIDVMNHRYNPHGGVTQQEFKVPVEDRSADIVYLYSVFSHLREKDIRAYLKAFARILKPGGTLFLTAFIETDVPPESENPADYCGGHWQGPLHCVRFEAGHFRNLLGEYGFQIVREEHGTETDGQSALYMDVPCAM